MEVGCWVEFFGGVVVVVDVFDDVVFGVFEVDGVVVEEVELDVWFFVGVEYVYVCLVV